MLLDTPPDDHFDVVLPAIDGNTLDAATGTFVARLTGPITPVDDVANTGAHV